MAMAERSVAGFSVMQSIQPVNSERVRDFRSWMDFVHDHFPWLEHRNHSDGRFEADVSSYRVGAGALSTIRVGASEVIRTRHLAETSESGSLKLIWQMAGDMRIEQDDRSSVIEVGQATVCDTARPYRIRLSERSNFAVFMLPYSSCPGWEHISQKICGTRLAEGSTIRAALGALMGLTTLPHDPQDGDNDTVVQAVQLMLSASLHRSATERGATAFRNARLSKAQRYIVEHIANPELDANNLAAALGMSRRSLYMLFREHDLTPAKMIHDIRLEKSMRVLADACQLHRKITDIAFDLGFSDYATFSRLFKAHYGITPSEYRLKARAPAV
jgi:AraC family transcriptional regulator, positive regulator of tynA and feaB